MAIRAFLSTWSLVDDEIHNPIVDHIDTQPDMGITCSMIYPDADVNGLPDKPMVLILVESQQVHGPVLEQLKNLDGVTLIPGQRPDKKMNSLPPSVANDIDGVVSSFGIPRSVVTGATAYSDFLGGIAKYVSPNSTGLSQYIQRRPLEFG